MGIYDRDYYRKDSPSLFDTIIPDGQVCRWLIGVNVLVYFLQLLFRTDLLRSPVTDWLQLDTAAVARGEVWRLLTYAFVHDPLWVWHLVFNMLFLWWFGTDVEVIYGPREFLSFYLVAAFLGGLAFQVTSLTQTAPMYCVGASGAITAVLLLCACHYPQRMVLVMMLVPVPIWIFVIVSVGQDVYRVMNSMHGFVEARPVAAVVHLAGAAF